MGFIEKFATLSVCSEEVNRKQMKTIAYYKVNKEFVAEKELNPVTVHDVHGMKYGV